MSKNPHSKARPQKEVKEFEEDVLQIDRVTRVVKGGRRLRFRATVIIGNRKGKVGVGVGKSEEVVGAIQKAVADAKKNLITVDLDGTTIPHQVKHKYKSARIILIPASEGTGIIAGGPIRKVVGLAGIQNLLSKSYGSTNKISCARATTEALDSLQKTPFSKRAEFKVIEKKPQQDNKQNRNNRPNRPNRPNAPRPNAPRPEAAPKPEAAPAPKAEAAPKPEAAPAPAGKPEEQKKESN